MSQFPERNPPSTLRRLLSLQGTVMKRPMFHRAALTALITLACWPAASFADKACEASWAKVDKCVTGTDGACKAPLLPNNDPEAIRLAIGFDFLRDGCLPSAGVS